jgi:Tfp pilus assembly protein PilE
VLFFSPQARIAVFETNLPVDDGGYVGKGGQEQGGEMNRKGITLAELLVALSVGAFLVASASFSYEKWMGNYEVESETKDLYADLMRTRLLAIEKGREHFLKTNGTSYTIYEDRDEDGVPEPGEELPSFPKKVKYLLKSNVASSLSFSTRGMLSVQRTLHFDLTDSGLSPDYDCMKISRTRIILGRYRGTECTID